MGEPKKTPEVPTPPDVKSEPVNKPTAAQFVKRLVPVVNENGTPTGETEAIDVRGEEVFSWAVVGKRVIVVTVDGQKLEGSL